MVGRQTHTEPNQQTIFAYRTIVQTLSVAMFAGALLMIVTTVYGTPLGVQNKPFILVLYVCATTPIIYFWFWRQQRLEKTNAQLRRLAYQDTMLGCLNRHGFTASAESALKSACLHHPCTLLVIDVDNFKRVNDNFGHLEGDNALQIVVAAIRACVRTTDVVGRIGGEEFGVLLAGAETARGRTIAARIRESVAKAIYAPEGTAHPLSVSIGGAVAEAPISFTKIFAVADKHLFAAKQLGRNRVAFTTPEPFDDETVNAKETAA